MVTDGRCLRIRVMLPIVWKEKDQFTKHSQTEYNGEKVKRGYIFKDMGRVNLSMKLCCKATRRSFPRGCQALDIIIGLVLVSFPANCEGLLLLYTSLASFIWRNIIDMNSGGPPISLVTENSTDSEQAEFPTRLRTKPGIHHQCLRYHEQVSTLTLIWSHYGRIHVAQFPNVLCPYLVKVPHELFWLRIW